MIRTVEPHSPEWHAIRLRHLKQQRDWLAANRPDLSARVEDAISAAIDRISA